MQHIHFLLMWGTIDSHWEARLDTAVTNSTSVIPKYFESMILYAEYTFETICLKDSRSILREDLGLLLARLHACEHDKIIITHGTYTMPDTAKYIEANLARKDLAIIFTGSMVPLEGFNPSDAPFNLGYAVAQLEHIAPGVYVAMNGRMFTPGEIAKSLSEGKFYSVFESRNNN